MYMNATALPYLIMIFHQAVYRFLQTYAQGHIWYISHTAPYIVLKLRVPKPKFSLSQNICNPTRYTVFDD